MEGIELQKLELDLAIDGEEWDKADRLLKLIRLGRESPPGMTPPPANRTKPRRLHPRRGFCLCLHRRAKALHWPK
jgi:hypothetical protein